MYELIRRLEPNTQKNHRRIHPRISRNVESPLVYGGPGTRDRIEGRIKDLIVSRKFEEAYDYTRKAYYVEIMERCTKMLRPYVSNAGVDAEDVIQQVFLDFLEMLKAGKYDLSKGSIHGLLLTIARGCVIDNLRTRNRIVPGRDTDLSELDRRDVQASYARNPELMILEAQESKILYSEVERLSSKERQILHLRYTLGHSTVEIAQFMGEKRGTIASRISRACARLRAEMEQ